MFENSKRAAVGAVVLSGVTVSIGIGGATAAEPPLSKSWSRSTPYCAALVPSPEAVRDGERSVMICAATAPAAREELERQTESTSFSAAAAFTAAGTFALAEFYDGGSGDRFGEAPMLRLYSDNCQLGMNLDPPFNDRFSSVKMLACSSVRLYKGRDFVDPSPPVQGNTGDIIGFGNFSDQVSSIRFEY